MARASAWFILTRTFKAQRWEPVEVLRALFVEEASGRERSALAPRRAAAGFPGDRCNQLKPTSGNMLSDREGQGMTHRSRRVQ